MVVNNNLGQAYGVPVGDGSVYRFSVRYATAARFADPVVASQWIMPNNDSAALPLACPQSGLGASEYSEDCLYAVVYVPTSVLNNPSSAPVYMWFHGGSFYAGSATDPGLDGSKLAKSMNGIVVFAQYRLGVLGWLPPSTASTASGNLGVKDAIAALKFAKQTLSYFGSNGKVTVGGQSSGGHMVRSLLASPEAVNYFQGATLHGDPVQWAFLKNSVYQSLQTTFYSSLCSGGNLACMKSKSVSDILDAQDSFIFNGVAYYVDPSVGNGEPLRPVVDGTTIKYTLTTTFPPTKRPVLMTTNKNEGGQAVGQWFPQGLTTDAFLPSIQGTLGNDRAQTVNDSPYYNPTGSNLVEPYVQNGDVTRQSFDRVGTDQSWRCENWAFARRWTAAGGTAYVGVFELGATYPTNANIDYCTTPLTSGGTNPVCHEDEIYIIFGSTPNPSSAQTTLSTEIQTRLSKFITNPAASTGPNASGLGWTWNKSGTSDVKAVKLGGSASGQAVPAYGCDPSFWGAAVPFDWQMYNE
ncbi:hypothetical protein M407DRAFT_70684 [Tulasnella calospora MUT 4182]|uniref:Carboxylesterase type B domain-containing protein n=1 Tax=Tulasnella calospora MUT 4182 TaxID=1051891 RepID=A0A0C3QPQ6_9AGAM|nr:hypothetical protein M407DRAFT_70684 [Tulasnella calospora MUT 4182]